MSSKHAFLSPSGSERWLNCTPSAFLESLEPYRGPSIYAEEGTEAHTLSEIRLSYRLGHISTTLYETKFKDFKDSSKYYTAEFDEYVNDFCTKVMDLINHDYKDLSVTVKLEDHVEFKDVVPDGSGTSDVVIIGPDFIHVIDLKFGRGVPVSAIGNSQLRLYALGALMKYRLHGVFTEVRMTVCQPRLYDTTTDYMSVQDLNNWATDYVKPRADLAILGKGDLNPGDHCRFCKRRGKCEALGQFQLEVAQQEFELTLTDDNEIIEPQNMSPDMLKRILDVGPKFIDWFKSVQDYVTATMVNEGTKIPGYKVVEGRSNRVLIETDKIREKLKILGFPESDYMSQPKLLGITKLEKNIGKKRFNDHCGEHIIKPIGKPTVVAESDRRPALDTHQFKLVGQEFEGDYNEE